LIKEFGGFFSPLRQFGPEINEHIYATLESRFGQKVGLGSSPTDNSSFSKTISLLDLSPNEVGQMIRSSKDGKKVLKFIRYLPRIEVSCSVHPVTRGILRFMLHLKPEFDWNVRWHGGAQGFWLWVEDGKGDRIYHHEYILCSKRVHPDPLEIELKIPAFEPLPPQYYVKVISDSFVGSETVFPVSFQHLLLPEHKMPYTDLMDLTPLPIKALQNPKFESLYKNFDMFNPIQTQLFHVLYHTDSPVLLGAPTGSGKTIVAEIALLRMKRILPSAKCVYIAPLKSLARERLKEWRTKLGSNKSLNWTVLELSGDTHYDGKALRKADVLVCTPEKWDLITRGWRNDVRRGAHNSKSKKIHTDKSGNVDNGEHHFVKDVRLLVIDEIHLLGEERGAVLEAIVSRTRYISRILKNEGKKKIQLGTSSPISNKNNSNISEIDYEATRIIGLSTALANPHDLANWIGINTNEYGSNNNRGLYNFRPTVRPVPLTVHVSGYAGRHYCPRMAMMNKPCYAAIKEHSPTKPVIIFVASRRQTRLTALDLISYAAGDVNPRSFLGCDDAYIDAIALTLNDTALRHTITFGIGLHHAGLSRKDRDTVEKLFLKGEIQVLVATATLAWGVNLPAHLVIVKGTEYFDGKLARYVDYPVTDVLQMMGRAGRPQFDKSGVACVMVAESKKNFYKKFLYEPFPVESCLNLRMADNINAEVAIGTIGSVADCIDYLSCTFHARRVKVNPSYYGATSNNGDDLNAYFFETVKKCLLELHEYGCILFGGADENFSEFSEIRSTILGLVSSKFYLNFRSPAQLRDGLQAARKIIYTKLPPYTDVSEGNCKSKENDDNFVHIAFSFPSIMEEAAVSLILFVVSRIHEFDELPVRHNEEKLNAELSKSLPWGPDCTSTIGREDIKELGQTDSQYKDEIMIDPHTKCFLLIQSFIFEIKVPISDYLNDTLTVMDQIPRLLAAIEFLIKDDFMNPGIFDFLCLISIVRQAISVKSVFRDNPLQQLKGMTRNGVNRLRSKGITSLSQLCIMQERDTFNNLNFLFNARKGESSGQMRLMINQIRSFPLATADNFHIEFEREKSSGEDLALLKFDLIFHNSHEYKSEKENSYGTLAIILGTVRNSMLLSSKSLKIPVRNKLLLTKFELKFDWKMANANGGNKNGHMKLRLINEIVRGLDVEYIVPLR